MIILELFENDFDYLKGKVSAFSFTDENTRQAMKEVHKASGYILDPHGAVGTFLKRNKSYYGVFLETAHPIKFSDTVEKVIDKPLEVPASIQEIMKQERKAHKIKNYSELKSYLLG